MRRINPTVKFDYPVENEDGTETIYAVTARILPEEKAVFTLRNGDPGYPGSPAEIDEITLELDGREVPVESLPVQIYKDIEEQVWAEYSDTNEYDYMDC